MQHFVRIIFAMTIIALSGCNKNDTATSPTQPVDKISLGQTVDAGSSAVGSSGGTISVNRPGTPVDGITITVPANAYPDARTFSISYAPITGHQFGSDFNPISPLIMIRNGGGYAQDPMQVKIPVHIPAGQFALGFFYNQKTQALEAMGLVDQDSTSITVESRHFDASGISNSSPAKSVNPRIQDGSAIGNIIIAAIDRNRVMAMSVINSGFTPGRDDWEFTNYGSYLAPGGHCAGQSMSAMWYFYERKHFDGDLFHHYDRVGTSQQVMWQDNREGYAWASAVQCNFNWSDWVARVQLAKGHGPENLLAFSFAMLVTHEPQFVLIRNGTTFSGHAMVVYAVSPLEGILKIADPNHPGDSTNRIVMSGGVFQPYTTGMRADGTPVAFDQIGWFAKTAYITWNQIGTRYAQFAGNTIHDLVFPPATVWVQEGSGYALRDGLNTDADSLPLSLRDFDQSRFAQIGFYAYDTVGNVLNTNAGVVPLRPGVNVIGIYVVGEPVSDCSGRVPATHAYQWVDFRWYTVTREGMTIASRNANGAPFAATGSIDTTFTVVASGLVNRPAQTRYTWSFGDGSSSVDRVNDSTVQHRFSLAGDFTVTVDAFDHSSGSKLAHAQAVAHVSGGARISSVVPDSGAGGTPVVIGGSGFGATQAPSAKVYFGTRGTNVSYALPAEIVTWSDAAITCIAPIMPVGSMQIFVDPGNGRFTNLITFVEYRTVITGISPSHGIAGTIDTIFGRGFGATQGSSYVQWNCSGVTTHPFVHAWSDSRIVVAIPDSASDRYEATLQVWVHSINLSNTATFRVDLNFRRWLAMCTKMEVHFAGDNVYRVDQGGEVRYDTISWDMLNFGWGAQGAGTPHLQWDGTQFSDSIPCGSGSATGYTTIRGRLSEDGTRIITLNGSYYLFEPSLSNRTTSATIQMSDVPFDSISSPTWFRLVLLRQDIPAHVQFHKVVDASQDPMPSVVTYITTVWNSTRATATADVTAIP